MTSAIGVLEVVDSKPDRDTNDCFLGPIRISRCWTDGSRSENLYLIRPRTALCILAEGSGSPEAHVSRYDDRFLLCRSTGRGRHKPLPAIRYAYTFGRGCLDCVFGADAYCPSWQVLLDGKYRPFARAAGALRSVFVRPEDRQVEFRFQNEYLRTLLWIAGGGYVAVALLVVFGG
jgi:hypothetical protein